ncbi:hypothetical protein A4G30_20790 [Mycobacterium kansasii]|uniref:Uncharacterized protein n=1 Tax=Mycobacterium kansasii ATCC 12478 TaxID=557599 RepID=U5WZJ0_MYCKA|nr:hypothetical protein MKAN_21390 [Mycobacterium kansasii ATCC 12478]KZS80847.1 hypothetical protein A4G30_20790 [Mycobacterium kansasii]
MRGRQLRRGGLAVDEFEVAVGPFPQLRAALGVSFDHRRVDADQFGHPRVRVDWTPFRAN